MTAQIAIRNDKCIALATDSAVSLTNNCYIAKMYNSECKLFQLSETHPVGVMYYGCADLAGVNIETLIKLYRKYLNGKLLDTLDAYVKGFIEFIDKNKKNLFTKEEIEKNFKADIQTYLERCIFTPFERDLEIAESQGNKVKASEILNKILDAFELALKKEENPGEKFKGVEISKNDKAFHDMLKRICPPELEITLTKDSVARIKKNLNIVLKKQGLIGKLSGLVFAGFGEKEMHPEIKNIEFYRVIITEDRKNVIVDYMDNEKELKEYEHEIFPFAQAQDMVNLYLEGIDTYYSSSIKGFFRTSMNNVIEKIEKILKKRNDKPLSDSIGIEKIIDDEMRIFSEKMFDYSDDNFVMPMRSLLFGLPREELANMAEMLIKLTSFKQRVSNEEQSVSDPIDVAVITKADGFVWHKRKETLTLK